MSHYCVRRIQLLLMLLLPFTASAQLSKSETRKIFLKADKAFEYGDFLSALEGYKKLYPYDSLDAELNYKIGVCSFELKRYRHESLNYFTRSNNNDFPETDYYLGRLYHLQRDYERAIGYYTKYKYLKLGEEHSRKEIDDLISRSNTARLLESTANRTIQIKNLGDTVNTEFAEYAPLIPAEENFLVFTSRRKGIHSEKDPFGDFFEDIYMSRKVQGSWQQPEALDTVINSPLHDACTGLSADGEKLLIYRTSKDLRSGDIYESNFVNNKWGLPIMLGNIVNDPEYLETSACYSPDGSSVFFSSNRPGGYGGKDIYMVKKLPNGKWAAPFNLGPSINTEYNEDAPFVHPAQKTLFFSSEGHENMGGYDIFRSTFDDSSHFSTPQNLGSPVNTVDDDIFFVLNTDGSLGYLSSEREGGLGSQDIYSVYFPTNNAPLSVYNIHVFDESGQVLTNVDILLSNMEQRTIYGMYKPNEKTGKILVISPPGQTYRIAIQSPGYESFISSTVFGTENELVFKLKKAAQ